jgi:hypothetical protein
MPTDDQLTEYLRRLPPIYRDILAAFPEVEPGRKAGDGIAVQTLTIHFANRKIGHSFGDVKEACQNLRAAGLLEIRNEIFAHPTELGERLIAMLTGKRPAEARIPELPAPTW